MSVLEFKLPDIGEGVHEGEIVRWIVAEGGVVQEDDPVVEVMTDKATVEIPSPATGTISRHLYGEGDVAKVGDVIFVVEDNGAAAPAAAAPASAAEPSAAEPAAAEPAAAPAAPPAVAPAAAPAEAAAAVVEFKLPDIGEGVHEGEIVRWIVAEGGAVQEDDPVVEVMTDKATVEIPSPASGVLTAQMVGEGEVANVGQVIFTITTAAGVQAAPAARAAGAASASAVPGATDVVSAASVAAAAPAGAPAAPVATLPAQPGKKVLAAPATRRLARELAIDLTTVVGNGPNGRIQPQDVRAAATAAPSATAAAAPAGTAAPSAAAVAAPAGGVPAATSGAASPAAAAPAALPIPVFPAVAGAREVDRVPFRGIRRKTAEAMERSMFTATHFSLIEEVDCTEMVAARTKAKEVGAKYGVKVTYMPYIMKAAAIALQEYPQLNAELDVDAQEILVKKYVNLGIAVDTPNGLVVPVVKDVPLKGILQLSSELNQVAGRARDGRLKPEDFSDGTFTLSNAGNIGGVFATPIINFPEVAIMGIHTMRKMPRCVGDDIVARQVMQLSISIDHRLVDGADGARFMVRVRELLEDPGLMLL